MANPYQDDGPDPEGGQPFAHDGAYDQSQQSSTPAPAGGAAAAAARKKRAYAGQAYEFGVGGNVAQGGQAPGGQYPAQQQTPQMGGYGYPAQGMPQQPAYGMPQQPAYGDPTMGSPAAQQAPYGQPAYGAAQGGYEAPAQGYPTQAGTPGMAPQGGIQGMTQQFSQMGMGGGQPAAQPQQPVVQLRLNPLQPVDISMQGPPFDVGVLDQPPPPIILPPNVSSEHLSRSDVANLVVIRHSFTARELPAEVCPIDPQRDASNVISS